MAQKMQNSKNISKIFYGFLAIFFLIACHPETESQEAESILPKTYHSLNQKNAWYENTKAITGRALGTTFVFKTSDDSLLITPIEVTHFFDDFNQELSTYIHSSMISLFNEKDSILDLNSTKYLKKCFETSQKIYDLTYGNFDPSVFPLVKLWGFVKSINIIPTQEQIDSVLQFTGLENEKNFSYENGILKKLDNRFELVFNAIAKGQAVDEIAQILEEKGQENYFLEIGGEIRVKGHNKKNLKWVIGIDTPSESNTGFDDIEHRPIENYIEISNKSMATSGNYRDFYIINGVEYGHSISPILGQPVQTQILSATVIADEVAIADAFATSFMVMGVDSSLDLIKNNPQINIDAYLLFRDERGTIQRAYTKGMLNYLIDK